MTKEYIYLVTDEIQLTPICEDCGPNLVPVMRKEELIRCKDCRWWVKDKRMGNIGRCFGRESQWAMHSDGFCSDAERRDDETD